MDFTNVQFSEEVVESLNSFLSNFTKRKVSLGFAKSNSYGEIFYNDSLGAVPFSCGSWIDSFIKEYEVSVKGWYKYEKDESFEVFPTFTLWLSYTLVGGGSNAFVCTLKYENGVIVTSLD